MQTNAVVVGISAMWMAVASASPGSSGTSSFEFAPVSVCPGTNGAPRACVIGEFKAGVAVRVVGGVASCKPVTGAPGVWLHPDADPPSGPEDLANRLASGQALKATLLEGFDRCENGDVALVGYRGEIQAVKLVPIKDSKELKRLGDRAAATRVLREAMVSYRARG